MLGYWWDTGSASILCYMSAMPTLKANSEVIKKALKGPRERYAISGHEGFYLHTRIETDDQGIERGNGSYLVRYRVGTTRRFHTLHRDARNATLADVNKAKKPGCRASS